MLEAHDLLCILQIVTLQLDLGARQGLASGSYRSKKV